MSDSSWRECEQIKYNKMRLVDLALSIRDAIDSVVPGVAFRDTGYKFNEDSLKDFIHVICADEGNRKRIIKKGDSLAQTFIDKLQKPVDRFPVIAEAIKDDRSLEKLYKKIVEKIK